jgi:tripartite-type tricarboxylate transporter receptor subunit TctC
LFKKMIIALSVIAAAASPAVASDFPTKPITIIVGVAPGGTLDALARLIAKGLPQHLGQPVVVENVTGAGGLVGMQKLAKADPDGHTLNFTNMSAVIIPHLHPKGGVDPMKDLTTVSNVGTVPMVLSVSNASGVKTLPELLEKIRKNPGKLNFGNGGAGTTAHLSEAMFLNMAKADATLVQYRGSGPALADLMAGTIDAVLDQTVTMMPLHADKRVKAIAISTPKRVPQLPDVPTFAEGGLPQFDLQIWNGLLAPKGTPKPVIDKLAAAVSKVIDSPEFKGRLEKLAADAPELSERGPEAMRQVMEKDTARVAELVKAIGLKPQQQ